MPKQNRLNSSSTDTLVESSTRTTSGSTDPLTGWGGVSTLRAQLNVTAVAGGAPSLTVRIEDTLDGENWNTVGSFAVLTNVGREVINVTGPFAGTIRVAWDLVESATFDVVAYNE